MENIYDGLKFGYGPYEYWQIKNSSDFQIIDEDYIISNSVLMRKIDGMYYSSTLFNANMNRYFVGTTCYADYSEETVYYNSKKLFTVSNNVDGKAIKINLWPSQYEFKYYREEDAMKNYIIECKSSHNQDVRTFITICDDVEFDWHGTLLSELNTINKTRILVKDIKKYIRWILSKYELDELFNISKVDVCVYKNKIDISISLDQPQCIMPQKSNYMALYNNLKDILNSYEININIIEFNPYDSPDIINHNIK